MIWWSGAVWLSKSSWGYEFTGHQRIHHAPWTPNHNVIIIWSIVTHHLTAGIQRNRVPPGQLVPANVTHCKSKHHFIIIWSIVTNELRMIWRNATFNIIMSLLVHWSPANTPCSVDTQTPSYHYLVKCHKSCEKRLSTQSWASWFAGHQRIHHAL